MITEAIQPILNLQQIPQRLPLETAIRIELQEGVPVMRATNKLQQRIEDLLHKQREFRLTNREQGEIERYEALDDYLSFVNRLIRNQLLVNTSAAARQPLSIAPCTVCGLVS